MQPAKSKSSTELYLLVVGLLVAGRCISCHEDVLSEQHSKPAGAGAAGVPVHGGGRVSQSAAAVLVVEAAAAAAAQHRMASSRPAPHADAHALQGAYDKRHRSQHRGQDDHTSDSSSRKDSRHRQQHAARLQSHGDEEIPQDINTDRHAQILDSSRVPRSQDDRPNGHRQHVSAHLMHRAALGRQSDDQQQQVEQPRARDRNHHSIGHSRHGEHPTVQPQHARVHQSTPAQPGGNLLEDPFADSHLLQWLAANGAAGSVDHIVTAPKHLSTKAAAPAGKAKAKSATAQSAEAAAAAAAAAQEEGQRLARYAESQKQHWQNEPINHASTSSHSSIDRRDRHEVKQVGSHASKQATAGYAASPQVHSPGATIVPANVMQTAVVHRRSMQQTTACRQGQVSQIRCWLDADGYITALAVESEDGITTPAVCAAKGMQADGGTLQEGESIVEIISCRSASGGVSYMEFHTDRLHKYPITCGSGMPVRTDTPISENTAMECENLSQAQSSSEPAARQVSVASVLATREQHRRADLSVPQDAYPIQGLRATCNARQQLAAFSNTCWADSTDSSKQPKPDRS